MNSRPLLRKRLNILGVAIIALGLCAAAGIWIAQDRSERRNGAQDLIQSGLLDSRKATRQLELYAGRSGVVAEEWSESLQSFFHGKRLAGTVAVFSSVVGIGFMLAADYLVPRGR